MLGADQLYRFVATLRLNTGQHNLYWFEVSSMMVRMILLQADDVGVRLGASVRARRCCTRLRDGCRTTAAALSSNDKVSEEGATAAVEDTDS